MGGGRAEVGAGGGREAGGEGGGCRAGAHSAWEDGGERAGDTRPEPGSPARDALVEHGRLASAAERAKFRHICRFLAAIYHHEYFDQLERLRQDYFYFNPELDPHARFDTAAQEAAYADLVNSFTTVLKNANFVEMSHAEIEQAHRERKAMRVEVDAPLDDFRHVRFFPRGHHHATIQTAPWRGLRRHAHDSL